MKNLLCSCFTVNSILLVSIGGVVSVVTALSVCAISTNGFIKEGNLFKYFNNVTFKNKNSN